MKLGKLWRDAAKRRVSRTKFTAVIDGDIWLYHATTQNLEEVSENDDEWSYRLDMDKVKEEMRTRVTETIVELGLADEKSVLMCFGSLGNWRKKIMPEYKAHRVRRKPLGYRAAMEWCKSQWSCLQNHELEADDLIGLMLTGPNGSTCIAVSEDKDMLTLPGLHYNPRKPDNGVVSITVEQADRNHMLQTLIGDSADGYKGCPGMGPVSADKLLNGPRNPHDTDWDLVVEAYTKAGCRPEEALVNARVARILRTEDINKANQVVWWTPKTKRGKKA